MYSIQSLFDQVLFYVNLYCKCYIALRLLQNCVIFGKEGLSGVVLD